MELTNKILECDKKAFISVNLGEDINFEFDNRDNRSDCRKKTSPSKMNRNQVRRKEFDQRRIEDNINRSRKDSIKKELSDNATQADIPDKYDNETQTNCISFHENASIQTERFTTKSVEVLTDMHGLKEEYCTKVIKPLSNECLVEMAVSRAKSLSDDGRFIKNEFEFNCRGTSLDREM